MASRSFQSTTLFRPYIRVAERLATMMIKRLVVEAVWKLTPRASKMGT